MVIEQKKASEPKLDSTNAIEKKPEEKKGSKTGNIIRMGILILVFALLIFLVIKGILSG